MVQKQSWKVWYFQKDKFFTIFFCLFLGLLYASFFVKVFCYLWRHPLRMTFLIG